MRFLKAARITKRKSSSAKLLEATAELHRDMNISEDLRNPLLQVLLSLSTNTIKDTFYHLDGKIGEFSDQNKWTVAS